MEPSTGLVILGTAIGSAKLVERILGPTADYIGTGVEAWTKRRVDNVTRIFKNAETKLGARLATEGSVPPRVLKEIMQEGSFCDDELSAEYFGGVLASSRGEISRDDRGAAFAQLVSRLTAYQVRTHYLLYSVIRTAFKGQHLLINTPEGPGQLTSFITRKSFAACMGLLPEEDLLVITGHALFGLDREDLINTFISTTVEDFAEGYNVDVKENGILYQPSTLGVELFLWAHGRGDVPVWEFLKSDLDLGEGAVLGCEPQFTTFPQRFRTSSVLSRKRLQENTL